MGLLPWEATLVTSFTDSDPEQWRDRLAAMADGPTLPVRLHVVQMAGGPEGDPQAAPYYLGSCEWSPEAGRYFGEMKPLIVAEAARRRREFWTDPYACGVLSRRFTPGVLALVTRVLEGEHVAQVATTGKVTPKALKGWLRQVRAFVDEVLYPADPQQVEAARRAKARRTVYTDHATYDDLAAARVHRFAAMTPQQRDHWREQKRQELRAAS